MKYTKTTQRLAKNKVLVVFGYVVFTLIVGTVVLAIFGDKIFK